MPFAYAPPGLLRAVTVFETVRELNIVNTDVHVDDFSDVSTPASGKRLTVVVTYCAHQTVRTLLSLCKKVTSVSLTRNVLTMMSLAMGGPMAEYDAALQSWCSFLPPSLRMFCTNLAASVQGVESCLRRDIFHASSVHILELYTRVFCDWERSAVPVLVELVLEDAYEMRDVDLAKVIQLGCSLETLSISGCIMASTVSARSIAAHRTLRSVAMDRTDIGEIYLQLLCRSDFSDHVLHVVVPEQLRHTATCNQRNILMTHSREKSKTRAAIPQ